MVPDVRVTAASGLMTTVDESAVNVPVLVNNVPVVLAPVIVMVGVPVAVIVPAFVIFSVVIVSVEALATVKVLLANIERVSFVYELPPSTNNAPLVELCITSSSSLFSYWVKSVVETLVFSLLPIVKTPVFKTIPVTATPLYFVTPVVSRLSDTVSTNTVIISLVVGCGTLAILQALLAIVPV